MASYLVQGSPAVLAVATGPLERGELRQRKRSGDAGASESDRSSDSVFSMEADRCGARAALAAAPLCWLCCPSTRLSCSSQGGNARPACASLHARHGTRRERSKRRLPLAAAVCFCAHISACFRALEEQSRM